MFVRAIKEMAVPNPSKAGPVEHWPRLPMFLISECHLDPPHYTSENRNLIVCHRCLHAFAALKIKKHKKKIEGRDPAGRSSHRYRCSPVYI